MNGRSHTDTKINLSSRPRIGTGMPGDAALYDRLQAGIAKRSRSSVADIAIVPLPPPSIRHLTETDLARRWRMSERTLQAWRWRKTGPPYVKVVGRVLYRLSDVETFETNHLQGGRR